MQQHFVAEPCAKKMVARVHELAGRVGCVDVGGGADVQEFADEEMQGSLCRALWLCGDCGKSG